MPFNIENVASDMLTVFRETARKDLKKVKSVARQFVERRKTRLTLLAALRIKGEITEEEFQSRLEDFRLVEEAEYNALKVSEKAALQRAANAVIEVFENAVKTALGIVL